MNVGARVTSLLEVLHEHMLAVPVTGDLRTCTDCRDELAKALRAAARDAWDEAIRHSLGTRPDFTQASEVVAARERWIGGVADEPAATDNPAGCAVSGGGSGAGAVAGDRKGD